MYNVVVRSVLSFIGLCLFIYFVTKSFERSSLKSLRMKPYNALTTSLISFFRCRELDGIGGF